LPKIRSEFSTLVLDLHNFETSGLYGDTKNELPRATCDFTSNPKGSCTPATDTLMIRFNIRAHDPLNPGTFIELPTRLVWEIQDKGTTIFNAVIDVQWLPSPCASGKFLFDVPVSTDVTGFIVGADLATKILIGTASATLSDTSGAAAGNIKGLGGGRSITANASTSITGTLTRAAKTCGAFENFDVSSFMVSGTGSNGPHEFDLTLSASSLVTGPNGVLQSGKVDGQFFADSHFGTFSGIMDITPPDKVPGHNLIIDFVDRKIDFADFVHKFFGKRPPA
jgi:hypothetical protein